ncbi:MBL fold metallo-hydrolase [Candidatus Riflebacteria bacterium]
MAYLVSDGIYLLGRYGHFACGCWVLTHNRKAVILEQPPAYAEGPYPWNDAKEFVESNNLEVVKLLLTHAHVDHSGGIQNFRYKFKKGTGLFHTSFLHTPVFASNSYFREPRRETFFNEGIKKLTLGSEPLYLVHAPKHSFQDTLIFFRGCVITGDWLIGPFREPCVPPDIVRKTLRKVKKFLLRNNYHVHTLLSVHANDIRRDINFYALLEEMSAFYRGKRGCQLFPIGHKRNMLSNLR